MSKWADYCITKYEYQNDIQVISEVEVREFLGDKLGNSFRLSRYDLIRYHNNEKSFCTVKKNEKVLWIKESDVYFRNSIFENYVISINNDLLLDNLGNIPLLLPKRKTFISFYHKDEYYRELFEKITSDIITNKSVPYGAIKDDNSTDYIKHLIQDGYLSDTTVVICLVGPETKHRKHVDWELSGGLDYKVGNTHAALIGILLPNHPDYGRGQYSFDNLPKRLAANAESKYAIIIDWSHDTRFIQTIIEKSFNNRCINEDKIINRDIPQMQKNTN